MQKFFLMLQPATKNLKVEDILKKAFFYWKKTLIYQVLFSLLHISFLITVFIYSLEHFGLLDDYLKSIELFSNGRVEEYKATQQKIMSNPNYQNFSWVLIAAVVFLYPMHLGFYKMFRKIDWNEKPKTEDMFAGYLGVNFFIYSSYYLFWILIFGMLSQLFLGLGFIWVAITLLSAPLMFFRNIRIFQSLNINLQVWKNYLAVMLICGIVAVAVKIIGMVSIIGIIFVFGFSNALIYAVYREIFPDETKNSI